MTAVCCKKKGFSPSLLKCHSKFNRFREVNTQVTCILSSRCNSSITLDIEKYWLALSAARGHMTNCSMYYVIVYLVLPLLPKSDVTLSYIYSRLQTKRKRKKKHAHQEKISSSLVEYNKTCNKRAGVLINLTNGCVPTDYTGGNSCKEEITACFNVFLKTETSCRYGEVILDCVKLDTSVVIRCIH